MSDTNSAYCPLPWSHIYVGPNGKIAPCCIGKHIGNYGETTLEEAWNSDKMRQLRLDMLSDVKNELCSNCYKKEDMGFKSMRQTTAIRMPTPVKEQKAITNDDGSLNEFKLTYLDIRFDNLCNFKCRTCNPMFSSSVAVESIKNPEVQDYFRIFDSALFKNKNIIAEVEKHYEHVKHIYFAGGEPMMQEEHWNILKYFVESNTAKNVSLIYSTNTSKLSYKNDSIFNYWKHFKGVHVQMSIDAEGRRAEYWRDGTNWEELFNNIKTIKENSNLTTGKSKIQYSIHSVITWVNVYSYMELVKILLNEQLSVGNNMTIWCLEDEGEFSLRSLPDFKKEEISIAIDNFIIYLEQYNIKNVNLAGLPASNIVTNMKNIKSFMLTASNYLVSPKTFNKNRLLDKIRGKDFLDYFPEHENMKGYINE